MVVLQAGVTRAVVWPGEPLVCEHFCVVGTPEAAMVGRALSFRSGALPVLSAGRPLGLGFPGEACTSLDVKFLFCEVVALTHGFRCFVERWTPLRVTGTLQPLTLGAVLSCPVIGPPLLWAAWLLVFDSKHELEVDVFRLPLVVGVPRGDDFLCLGVPWAH